MKVRTGFVSNSSSSSFVIAGLKLTDNLRKKLEAKYPDDWQDKWDVTCESGPEWIVELIATEYEVGIESTEVRIKDLYERWQKEPKLVELLSIAKKEIGDVKIATGVELS